MTIKRLIGTAPSQIPRNKDLGNLAFQNKEWPRVDNLTIDGKIGVGTTIPQYNVDVVSDTNAIIRAYGSNIGRLSLQNSTRHYSMSVQGSSLLIYDETGGATRASLLSTGEFTFANGITPQYYNEQTLSYPTIRPTLNLDFAGSKSVDSRITFTRASAATYYGADGKLKYAVQNEPRIEYDPATGECKGLLIEEQRTNLALSNTIDGPYFVKEQCWVGAYTIAPDGSASAFKMTEDTSTAYHRVRLGSISVTSGNTYTISIYAKYAGRQYLVFNCDSLINARAAFDLVNGTATNISSTSVAITAVGNGWYRCSLTNTATLTQTTSAYFGGNTTATDNTYAGDGVSGIYMWGFQIEQGSFPTSYIPSTTTFTSRASSATYFDSTGTLRIAGTNQARYGYAYDSTLGKWLSQGLILESASTNYFTKPSSFATEGLDTATYTTTDVTSPDGTYSSGKIIESTYVGPHRIYFGFSVGSAGVKTYSVYVKELSSSPSDQAYTLEAWYSGYSVYGATFNLKTNTATLNAGIAAGLVDLGSGWKRIWLTASLPNATYNFYLFSSRTGSRDPAGSTSAGCYFYGFQIEDGYTATSVIPTYGSSVTRAADVSSSGATTRAAEPSFMAGSSIINSNEGTIYAEFSRNTGGVDTSGAYIFELRGPTSADSLRIRTGSDIRFQHVNLSNTVVLDTQLASSITSNAMYKVAGAYSTTDAAGSANASVPTTISISNLDKQLSTFYIGNVYTGSMLIKRLTYYPRRLSNTQLQALTA